jgi:hypothetical protein
MKSGRHQQKKFQNTPAIKNVPTQISIKAAQNFADINSKPLL